MSVPRPFSSRRLDGRLRRHPRALVLLALAGVLAVDATLVEPYALQTTRATIPAHVRAPLKIAHLSDLHTHGYGRRERGLVALLDAEHPDVIVVTGDVVDDGSLDPARELFEHLHAPRGVWVVLGNWENWRPPPLARGTYVSMGARLLVNEGALVRPDLWLAGFDDSMSGFPDVEAALLGAPASAEKVGLFHSPELFDRVASRIDLALAGHTHGGQVRVPLLGALWTPPGSGSFVSGWYASADARMFVSRGVGTSIIGVRFMCPPEVAFITLAPAP